MFFIIKDDDEKMCNLDVNFQILSFYDSLVVVGCSFLYALPGTWDYFTVVIYPRYEVLFTLRTIHIICDIQGGNWVDIVSHRLMEMKSYV